VKEGSKKLASQQELDSMKEEPGAAYRLNADKAEMDARIGAIEGEVVGLLREVEFEARNNNRMMDSFRAAVSQRILVPPTPPVDGNITLSDEFFGQDSSTVLTTSTPLLSQKMKPASSMKGVSALEIREVIYAN
jgi:hypothetical protein